MSPHEAFDRAWSWAAAQDFSGYDPYDALGSPFLAALHQLLGRSFGIAATQLVRRSPISLRPLLGIKPAVNSKGLGLFLSAAARTGRPDETRALADRLRNLQVAGWGVPCWGYPFPWRARAFYLPAGTPTIVATSFVGEAFLDAYQLCGDPRDLETALGACQFIGKLNRTEDDTGACLSYSPIDRSAVYNASVLGARLLVRAGVASTRKDLIVAAEPLVRYVLARQRQNGAWTYGEASYQTWIDSFHTGFVLSALDAYARATGDTTAASAVVRGARFYREHFFGPAGEPYYFADRAYPFDVHSAAQGLITLAQLGASDASFRTMAERVGSFLIGRFLSPDGHFRYQIRRWHRVSIPYMRWSQAWGVRGLASLVEGQIGP
jgi:hypothetical protein